MGYGLMPAPLRLALPGGDNVDIRQAQSVRTGTTTSRRLEPFSPPPFVDWPESGYHPIVVDPTEQFQQIMGFGATLSDAAAYVLNTYLTQSQRTTLLTELFSPAQNNWSTLRIGVGGTEFQNGNPYTYNDLATGLTDVSQAAFSIAPDKRYIIPIIREILAINPRVRIIAVPYTAPAWMKDSGSLNGGTIPDANLPAYSTYLVKFIQAYRAYDIPIWALAIQNEPTRSMGYPSMQLTAAQAVTLIGSNLGPAIDAAKLGTKLLVWEDGWASSETYIKAVLSDPTASSYVEGSSFHGYNGVPFAQAPIRRSFPGKSIHFTNQQTVLTNTFGTAMKAMGVDAAVGALTYGASSVTVGQLALDQNGNPSGTVTGRRGAITVTNDGSGTITRNADYYMLTHLAKYVKQGARRIACNTYTERQADLEVAAVAFQNQDRSIVLFVFNNTLATQTFQILDARTGEGFPVSLNSNETYTFMWGTKEFSAPAGAPSTLTGPATPSLTATAAPQQVTLTWTAPTSAAPISGYEIFRASGGGAPVRVAREPGTSLSFIDTGLTNGVAYTYTMVARSMIGTSGTSAGATATPAAPTLPPAAPVLSGVAGDASVVLSWTIPADNGSTITGYQVRRKTGAGAYADLGSPTDAVTLTYTDTTAVNGTTYSYVVRAINVNGPSADSNAFTGTPAAPIIAPSSAIITTSASTSPTAGTANRIAVRTGTPELWIETGADVSTDAVTLDAFLSYDQAFFYDGATGDKLILHRSNKIQTILLAAPGSPPSLSANQVRVEVDFSGIPTGRLWVGTSGGTASVMFTARDPRLHPFTETSPWNIGMATTATLEADVSAGVRGPITADLKKLKNGVRIPTFINQQNFSHPVYQARFTDPRKSFRDTQAHSGRPSEYLPMGGIRDRHIPTYAQVALGSDGHMHIVRPGNRYIDEMIGVHEMTDGRSDYSVTRTAAIDLYGTGLGPQNGVRAYGGAAVGGLVRGWEIDPNHPRYTGEIRHAIAFALDGAQMYKNPALTSGSTGYALSGALTPTNAGYVWPAFEQDFNWFTNYLGQIPMGQAFQFDPAVNIETVTRTVGGVAVGLTPSGKMLAYAYQRYGGILTDQTIGSTTLAYVETGATQVWRGEIATTHPNDTSISNDREIIVNNLIAVTNNASATPMGGAIGATRLGTAAPALLRP
jgi:glucosylceramidase